ncbi:histidine kinase [Actinomycetospora sp. OC33-EN08]|uniref:histidine kinase n=1 Tax=Actinomycetospora aurantiaca TaxID=3129233 RepID=A0ABU8MN76_9PSEU
MTTTRRGLVPGLGCAVVAVGLLALLPLVADGEPVPGIEERAWWFLLATVLVQSAAVVGSQRRPELLLVVAAVPLLPAVAAPSAGFSVTAVGVLVGTFLVVLHLRPLSRAALVLAAAVLLVGLGQAVNDGGAAPVAALLQALVVVGLPVLPALVVATQREAREARRQEVLALRREQEALAAAVAARERTAMSRELHDIAAHHMSGIAVMAAALGRLVETDPDAAKRSAALLRDQSRAVLDDLRRVVGLLRDGPDADRPTETVGAVAGLVAARREAGADVDLVRSDDGAVPGPLAQLVVYRMVQESLANAASHAPGAPCSVTVARHGDRLSVTVTNDPSDDVGRASGGGFGLVGMAERARLVGGTLAYGPIPSGGWEVRLTVPVEEDPA